MGQASPFSPSLCLATPSPSGAAPAPPSPSQALPLPSRSRAPPPSLPQGQAPPPSHSLVGRLSLTLYRTRSPSSASFLPFDIVSPEPSHSPRKTPKTPVGTPRPLQDPRPPAPPVPPQTPLLNPGPAYPRPPAPAQRTIWRRGDSAWPNQWGLTARRPAQTKTHTRGQAERPGGTVRRTIAGRESGAGAGAAGRAGRAAPGAAGGAGPGRAGGGRGRGGGIPRRRRPARSLACTLSLRHARETGKPPRVTWPRGRGRPGRGGRGHRRGPARDDAHCSG